MKIKNRLAKWSALWTATRGVPGSILIEDITELNTLLN